MSAKMNEILEQSSEAEPVADVINRVATELRHLAGEVADLQATLGDAFNASKLSNEFLRDLQSIDHIEQKLACLSEFLSSLTFLVDETSMVDIGKLVKTINLADLSKRLRGLDLSLPSANAIGDFELF